MDGKSAFGYDFLCYLQSMLLLGSEGKSISKAAGAAVLFLVDWGFNYYQAYGLELKLKNDLASGIIYNPKEVLERLTAHVKKDHLAIRRFIIHSIAIAYLDGNISQDAINFISAFTDLYNLEESEMKELIVQGLSVYKGLLLYENLSVNT